MRLRFLSIFSKFLFFLFISGQALGQQTFIQLGPGYGFKLASSTMTGFYNNTLSLNSYTEGQILLSVGSGIDVGGGIVVFGGDYMGFTMKYSHLFSQKTTATEVSNVSITSKEVKNTISGSFNRIEPGLIIRGESDMVTPYMEFGPVLSFGKAEWLQVEDFGQNKNTTTWQYTGGMGAGIAAAAGLSFEVGTLVHLFIEVSGYSLSWAPEKKSMIEAHANDKDILSSFPLKVREVEYVDERTYDYSTPPPDNQPDIQLRFTIPMSSVGLKTGLRIEL